MQIKPILGNIKKAVFVSILFSNLCLVSQTVPIKTYFISKDSIRFTFNEKWRYFPGDSPSMAGLKYNDSQWQLMRSGLNFNSLNPGEFKGIGWFRYHFRVDSSMVNIPLAIGITHFGASEIYLDGILLRKYGVIKDSAHCIYDNPQEVPFVFIIKDTGRHIFAVRYANYDALRNYRIFKNATAGFTLSIDLAENYIYISHYRSIVSSFIFIFLTGIFIVLCFLHLFLYLYYRVLRSNLFFSLFMLCLSCLTLTGYCTLLLNNVSLQLISIYLINYIICIGCICLSVFINELFFKKKKIRFWIIAGLGICSIVLRLLGVNSYILVTFALILSVSIEAAVTIIFAIFKRVKGARIIGIGILFFSLFFIALFLLAILSRDNFDINDSTPQGKLILLIAAMAILSVPLSMSVYLAWNFATINKNLALQVEEVKLLSEKNLEQEQEKVKLISGQNEMLEQKVEERTRELTLEKKKSDDLLLNILPEEIAEELKSKGKSDAQLYDHVSVLFTDFVGFTIVSEKLTPKELVDEINLFFTAFDDIIGRNGLEKIKTIGDAYMAVCGMPNHDADHAVKTVKAAKEIIQFVSDRKNVGSKFDIRIGINSGAVVAGIVGVKKFAYDIWGDTVNTAARMEQNSEPGKINISGATYELIKDEFDCSHRGKINAKNKGDIDMYFVGV